jgi:Domain of unknown function, B. Theta Gene description (DUF3871)
MEQNEVIVPEVIHENHYADPPLAHEEKVFITANTIGLPLEQIKRNHIIPVFVKDNEAAISQSDFIEATQEVVADIFASEHILKPVIRLSHPIKGQNTRSPK